jgi:phage-related protein
MQNTSQQKVTKNQNGSSYNAASKQDLNSVFEKFQNEFERSMVSYMIFRRRYVAATCMVESSW